MPPTKDIESAVREILEPFDENNEEGYNQFWDFWVIGGRWAGAKFKDTLNSEKLAEFHGELTQRKVTISGLQFGKQELSPASQISMVDKLWNEYFPEANGNACPLFRHSNDQHNSKDLLLGDVMEFSKIPMTVKPERVVFAAHKNDENKFEAVEMFTNSIWNGCNFEKTTWRGTISDALKKFKSNTTHYANEYKKKIKPKDDWLVVTVDYHN